MNITKNVSNAQKYVEITQKTNRMMLGKFSASAIVAAELFMLEIQAIARNPNSHYGHVIPLTVKMHLSDAVKMGF